MTLRDYFAGQAMPALLAAGFSIEAAADLAWNAADRMMQRRQLPGLRITLDAGKAKSSAGTPAELLRPAQAAKFLGISKTHFYKLRREDASFPKPARLGGRIAAFHAPELVAWATGAGVESHRT